MLVRRVPQSGYIADTVFKAYGFVQTVRAGDTVYVSGIAPLRGDFDTLELVGESDLRQQMEFCYDVLRRSLAEEGLGLEHVVSQTMYTTDMTTFVQVGGEVLASAFGDQGPTATAVGVTALFHPQQMFEVTAVAVGH